MAARGMAGFTGAAGITDQPCLQAGLRAKIPKPAITA